MNHELITALIAFVFVSSATPGPNNLMLLASGANFGFARSMPHMVGVSMGFAVMVLLVGVGLMRLFTAFPITYWILKSASIAYLLFLAWKIATAAPLGDGPSAQPGANIKPKPFTFLQAGLFQWVNPKAWVVALTAISAYTPPSHPLGSVFLAAFISGVVCLPCTSAWTAMGAQLRRWLDNPIKLRIFNLAAAALLLASLYPILIEPILLKP